MKNTNEMNLPGRLARGRERFEKWRSKHKPHTRLPAHLWSAAVKLAQEYGVNKTARVLRLDYNGLKNRIGATDSGDSSQAAAGPEFIELLGSELTAVSECAVECRHAKGDMIRIHFKGTQLPDLTALVGSLWNGDK